MISLIIISLLLIPLVLPCSKKTASFLSFYESLRELPTLPPSPGLIDYLRYVFHKAYFQYLITGPGYVLEPAERIIFDLFITVLLGAMIWCAILVAPLLIRLVEVCVLDSASVKGDVPLSKEEEGAVSRWSGNMSLSVWAAIWTARASVARNVTDFAL